MLSRDLDSRRERSFKPAGSVETDLKSPGDEPGRPAASSDGLGPNFTFGLPLDPYEL